MRCIFKTCWEVLGDTTFLQRSPIFLMVCYAPLIQLLWILILKAPPTIALGSLKLPYWRDWISKVVYKQWLITEEVQHLHSLKTRKARFFRAIYIPRIKFYPNYTLTRAPSLAFIIPLQNSLTESMFLIKHLYKIPSCLKTVH